MGFDYKLLRRTMKKLITSIIIVLFIITPAFAQLTAVQKKGEEMMINEYNRDLTGATVQNYFSKTEAQRIAIIRNWWTNKKRPNLVATKTAHEQTISDINALIAAGDNI